MISKSVRYIFNYKTDSMVRPMLAFDQSSAYPILDGKEETYQSQTIGGGVQLNFDLDILDGLSVQPHLLIKQLTMDIAPGGDDEVFSDTVQGLGADVGVELHYLTPFGAGVYLGSAYMNRPSLTMRGTDAIKHGVVGVNAGLSYGIDF